MIKIEEAIEMAKSEPNIAMLEVLVTLRKEIEMLRAVADASLALVVKFADWRQHDQFHWMDEMVALSNTVDNACVTGVLK